jgi:hypothetical protein
VPKFNGCISYNLTSTTIEICDISNDLCNKKQSDPESSFLRRNVKKSFKRHNAIIDDSGRTHNYKKKGKKVEEAHFFLGQRNSYCIRRTACFHIIEKFKKKQRFDKMFICEEHNL